MKMKNVKAALTMACMATFMLVSVAAFSQDKPYKSAEEKAKMMSDKMKTELTLSDEQYQKIQPINLDFATKTSAIPRDGDKSAWMDKMKSLDEDRSKSLKEILTPDQFSKYETMKKEMKGKMKDKDKS